MCLIVFLFLLRFWPLPSASWRAIYLPWQHCQLKGSTMWLPPFLERIDLWLPIEGSIFHRNCWNYPWIQVRMLGQFSFPQFLQAENNPHSAWTSVKLFLLGHQSSPVVTPSRKQVWQLQMAIKDTDPVIFKSLGCSCYDHQSKISTWIPRPGTNFGCTVVTAQFLHIFTGVSGVGIALWLALFFTGCSFWRRFACFVEPLGGKKTWKNTCTNAIAKLISQISNHWGHWCCYCEGLFVSHRTEWSKRSEDVAMFAKLHSASARFQKLRLWNWISDHIFFESVFLQLRPQVLRVSVQILRPKRCTGTTWPNVQAHRRNVWKLWEKLSGQETPNVKTKSSEERRILGM